MRVYYGLEVQLHGMGVKNEEQQRMLLAYIQYALETVARKYKGRDELTGDVQVEMTESAGEFE